MGNWHSLPDSASDRSFTLEFQGRQRQYLVHLPPNDAGDQPLPLVIMFHGWGGTGQGAMFETGWADKADTAQFRVVFPEAIAPHPDQPPRFLQNPQAWNNGSGRGHAARAEVDDVGFVRAMIEDLQQHFALDRQRIFATGFSNGASMCFHVGAELSDLIAAIAPVAGHFWSSRTQLSYPVSLMYLVGDADPLNPWQGGEIQYPWGGSEVRPPFITSVHQWVQLIGCAKAPKLLDQPGVRAMVYTAADSGAEVAFYMIEALGHVWPGGKSFLRQDWVGPGCQHFQATDVIWDFFVRHPRPGGLSGSDLAY